MAIMSTAPPSRPWRGAGFRCTVTTAIAAVLSTLAGFQALDQGGLARSFDSAPFLTPTGLRVEPLQLWHDAGPTFGFRIEAKTGRPRSGRVVALGYLADTGKWSSPLAEALAEVDVLGVEFNHDVALQRGSGRSAALIARVLGDRGHLSNEQGAGFVAAVLARSRPGTLRHLVLLHLSQQCNHPGLALGAARIVLRESGRRISLHAATQSAAHPNLWIKPASASARRFPNGRALRPQRSTDAIIADNLPLFGFGIEPEVVSSWEAKHTR